MRITKIAAVAASSVAVALGTMSTAHANDLDLGAGDITNDETAIVQDVLVNVQLEDSIKNVNVLGVAVQDAIKDNTIPININSNQVNLLISQNSIELSAGETDTGDE